MCGQSLRHGRSLVRVCRVAMRRLPMHVGRRRSSQLRLPELLTVRWRTLVRLGTSRCGRALLPLQRMRTPCEQQRGGCSWRSPAQHSSQATGRSRQRPLGIVIRPHDDGASVIPAAPQVRVASSHGVAGHSKRVAIANIDWRADGDREDVLDSSGTEDKGAQPIDEVEVRITILRSTRIPSPLREVFGVPLS